MSQEPRNRSRIFTDQYSVHGQNDALKHEATEAKEAYNTLVQELELDKTTVHDSKHAEEVSAKDAEQARQLLDLRVRGVYSIYFVCCKSTLCGQRRTVVAFV